MKNKDAVKVTVIDSPEEFLKVFGKPFTTNGSYSNPMVSHHALSKSFINQAVGKQCDICDKKMICGITAYLTSILIFMNVPLEDNYLEIGFPSGNVKAYSAGILWAEYDGMEKFNEYFVTEISPDLPELNSAGMADIRHAVNSLYHDFTIADLERHGVYYYVETLDANKLSTEIQDLMDEKT
jgi:hypothetical protein